jgi:flagellar basal body P-ring formation protein FlgA
MRRGSPTIGIALAAMLVAIAGNLLPARAEPTVVVPNRIIYPGQEIPAEALDMVPLRRQLSNPSAFVMEMEQVVGKVARSTLLPGRMIYTTAMRDAYLVEAGKPANVVFVNGSLTISMTAIPLQPGSAGDMIRVRNMQSGVVFSGVVLEDGTVRVSSS